MAYAARRDGDAYSHPSAQPVVKDVRSCRDWSSQARAASVASTHSRTIHATPWANHVTSTRLTVFLHLLPNTAGSSRKTAATILDEAALSARLVADQLGYSRTSMTRHYYLGRRAVDSQAASALVAALRGTLDNE